MHEGVFTEKIVETVLEELKKQPNSRIRQVKVKIGEVYHLVPESVLMHFSVAVKGTALEGVVLDLVEEPMIVECLRCHQTVKVDDHHMPMCNKCGSFNVKTISGNTVQVESIEFITEGAPAS